jgi:hypothetical protein
MPASTPARVQECAHIYPDGRTCRRIPKRGDKFCLGHQAHRQRRPGEEDEAFERQMTGWADQLDSMPLEKLLCATQESLIGIAELIDRKASRAHRIAFTRAAIAVSSTVNKMEEAMSGFRAQAIICSEPIRSEPRLATRSATQPGAPPNLRCIPSPHDAPHTPRALSSPEEKLEALDRLDAVCAKLLSTFPSNA